MTRRPAVLAATLAALVTLVQCGGEAENAGRSADSLSRRQRDSLIGESALPGAGGVRRALDAADSAAARRARADSIAP